MKRDDPIEVLRQVYQMERRLEDLQNRIPFLHEAATRGTASSAAGRTSGSPNRSAIERNMVTSIDLERQLERTRDKLIAKRYRIQNAIDAMRDEGGKRLIELRYLDHLSWTAVVTKLGISEAACFRLRKAALREFLENYQSDSF